MILSAYPFQNLKGNESVAEAMRKAAMLFIHNAEDTRKVVDQMEGFL
jgi:hypothetical protein